MEMVPDRHRTILGTCFQLPFAIGIALVAGWGNSFRKWHELQRVLGLHSWFLVLHWW